MTEFIDYKLVLSTCNPGDIAFIKSILDGEGVTYPPSHLPNIFNGVNM